MTTLLIKNAYIVTMDDHQREIPEGGMFIRRGLIQEVGPMNELPTTADEVLDLKGHVVFPGLVNTHHHFYQTLTRAVPAAQDANLFNWRKTLYPIPYCVLPLLLPDGLLLPVSVLPNSLQHTIPRRPILSPTKSDYFLCPVVHMLRLS